MVNQTSFSTDEDRYKMHIKITCRQPSRSVKKRKLVGTILRQNATMRLFDVEVLSIYETQHERPHNMTYILITVYAVSHAQTPISRADSP